MVQFGLPSCDIPAWIPVAIFKGPETLGIDSGAMTSIIPVEYAPDYPVPELTNDQKVNGLLHRFSNGD